MGYLVDSGVKYTNDWIGIGQVKLTKCFRKSYFSTMTENRTPYSDFMPSSW